MSLSDKSKSPKSSPVELYIEWSGSKGVFQYWDKEKEGNVVFEDDIFIVPLDELNTVRGFDKSSTSGIYANEVRNILTDVLEVSSFKGGDIAKGVWKNIKDKVGNTGGKFSKSVYAVLLSAKEYRLVNFQFVSSSLSPYFEAKVDVDSGQPLKLSFSTIELKNGNTTYFEPGIKKMKAKPEVTEKCVEIDRVLQDYLDTYFQVRIEDEIVKEVVQTEKPKEEKPKQEKEVDPLEAEFNKSMEEEVAKEKKAIEENEDFSDIEDLPW